MINRMRNWCGIAILSMVVVTQTFGAVNKAATALWEDFNHYVLIARPDLAGDKITDLLSLDEATLLEVVESGSYTNYEQILFRASKMQAIRESSQKLAAQIQLALIHRSREPKRIESDIRKLGASARANLNAIQRLRAAGQYATPAMLSTLQSESHKQLHPYILAAMVSIGRPLVYPLSVALPYLEPIQQSQIIQVLSEIGYPRALPYIKEVIEDKKADASVKKLADAAYQHLSEIAGITEKVNAAELYLTLAYNHYNASSRGEMILGYDASQKQGLLWQYDTTAGLVPIPVPKEIYGDTLTMRATRRALELNPNLSPALSLWLIANLNRENHLPKGQRDLSYSHEMRAPSFYLRGAGALRQHDVLQRALNDVDTPLALDAIEALNSTAGTDALINRKGTSQPLIRAMNYPDRRIRFQAAFTMTNAKPTVPFTGSNRVVPVLAEAIRQTNQQYAAVISRDDNKRKQLAAVLRDDMGMQVFSGKSLDDILEPSNAGPGIDLIVTILNFDDIVLLQKQRAMDYKLAKAPTLALVNTMAIQTKLNGMYSITDNIFPVLMTSEANKLEPAIEHAIQSLRGKPITEDEAFQYANTALDLLYEVATSQAGNNVYQIVDAQGALTQALNDDRDEIVIKAGRVLSFIASKKAQQAIAQAALDLSRASEVRIPLLESLATSATRFGNNLNENQIDKILQLVQTSEGDVSLAAARVHGALVLPTSDIVKMIVK